MGTIGGVSLTFVGLPKGTTSSLMVFGVGLTMCDIEVYNEKQWREPEQIFKKLIGTNCFLKFENMKMEWLVIAD